METKTRILVVAGLMLLVSALAAPLFGADQPDQQEGGTFLLRFEGNKTYSDKDLASVVPFDFEMVRDKDSLEAARRLVLSHYQTYGFLEARVQVSTVDANGRPEAVFAIDEGPRYRMGKTYVDNLSKFKPRVVFRELTYKEGDPYNQREIFRTQGKLYDLGLFREVHVRTSTTTHQTVDVHIEALAGPTKKVRGGVGYGSEERQRVSLAYIDQNLFHRAYGLEVDALYSAIWLEYRARLSDRYLFGTRTQGQAEAKWRREHREGYDLESISGKLSLTRKLWFNMMGGAAYRLQRTITYNLHPEVALTTPQKALISAVQLSLAHDDSNDPFFPTKGGRESLSVERAGGLVLGGGVNFNKTYLQAARYVPIWRKVVGALQARTGWAWPYTPSEEIPIYERFFTGGANSIRGYAERSVGPKDPFGAPLGGTRQLGGSAEVRFPLVWKFNGALFIDGGQVAYRYRDVQPVDWKYGAGGGIRFVTPVGPLRLDYGYKLNPDPGERQLWRIHLSLGEAF